jgi:hypothetical protein
VTALPTSDRPALHPRAHGAACQGAQPPLSFAAPTRSVLAILSLATRVREGLSLVPDALSNDLDRRVADTGADSDISADRNRLGKSDLTVPWHRQRKYASTN